MSVDSDPSWKDPTKTPLFLVTAFADTYVVTVCTPASASLPAVLLALLIQSAELLGCEEKPSGEIWTVSASSGVSSITITEIFGVPNFTSKERNMRTRAPRTGTSSVCVSAARRMRTCAALFTTILIVRLTV